MSTRRACRPSVNGLGGETLSPALIARLRDLGASTVVLDIVFAEPERHDGVGANPDATLAETISAGRVVLGYALTFEDVSEPSNRCFQHPISLAVDSKDHEPLADPFFRASNVICNLDMLSRAAAGSGFLNAAPDPDGILSESRFWRNSTAPSIPLWRWPQSRRRWRLGRPFCAPPT